MRFLHSSRVLLWSILFGVTVTLHAGPERPNFLIILADDLGYGDLRYLGGEAWTPNLDKLAASGVKLAAHYVHPMCSPTRAALLTGRYASRFGVTGAQNEQALPVGTATMASVLGKEGYDTALIGKWHLGSAVETAPNRFGFSYSYGCLAGGATPDTHEYKKGPHQRTWHRNGELIEEKGHITDLITAEAVKWIEERGSEPFFLYVPFTAVHVPMAEPEQWLGVNGHIKDPAKQLHAADVSHLDDSVGKLLAALERKGLKKNTVVLFLSDNGAHDGVDNKQDKYPGAETRPSMRVSGSNGPLRGWKGSVYEGGIRTPAIASWPGNWGPGTIETPVSVTNWLPTFCGLAGAPEPSKPSCDGRDISDWLRLGAKPADAPEPPVYCVAPGFRARMLRHGDFKLVVTEGKNGKPATMELFNLKLDPGETKNVMAENQGAVAQLSAMLPGYAAQDNTSVVPRRKPKGSTTE